MVELPVQVVDTHDVPVTGLNKEDFSVFEDNQRMQIEDFGTSRNIPLWLVIVVDTSGSMTATFPMVRRAVAGFAEHLLEDDDRVALVRFSSDTELLVAWTDKPSALTRSLNRVVPWGETALYDAVVLSLTQFENPQGRQAMVLLTDGVENASHSRVGYVKNFTRTMRVPIFPIGLVADDPEPHPRRIPRVRRNMALRTLAGETGGMAFFPKDVEELPAIYEEISELLRSQYVLWFRPDPNKSAEKFRSITVKVNNPSLRVRTIRGYYPGK
jgi:Ca-activated chloride channel family protein